MPNAVKYNVSAETLALKKGNFWIGTGDVGKGPTSSTGFYNGISPSTGGFTIYLNKASGGPSIYTVSNEAQLTALTNSISVSTNLIKNNNGGNFADGTIAPFNGSYGTMPTVVDITNDKPYNGSTSTKAAKFLADGGMLIYTDPSPFNMTVGVTYTFSFWYRQTNSNNFYIGFNNQGGSGDINGNFQAYSSYGYFLNPTQTWQRCSWTFTNVVNKPYFFIYRTSAEVGAECLMTEFTLTEGSMPSGPGLTTSGNCLNWFSTQTDKMIFNRDYESIVTNGLMLNFDAGFSPSFATIPSNANSSTVTPWYDLSGQGNNGTLINSPSYSSNNGGTLRFDGVDDRVLVSSETTSPFSFGTGPFTISFWYRNIDWSGYQNFWSSGAGSNGSQGVVGIRYSNNTYPYYYYANGFKIVDYNSQTMNVWYYSTLVGNGGSDGNRNIKLYLNGNQVGDTFTTNYNFSDGRFLIGANQSSLGGTEGTNGNISQFSIYNRALSNSEILQNFNALKGRYGL